MSDLTRIDELRHQIELRSEADAALLRFLRRAYPIGSRLTWWKWNARHTGTVVCHRHDNALGVQNARTGKSYYISLSEVTS